MHTSHRKGFSLVELLVVIGIIGILVALVVPAVQAARESARRAQCSNNVKQLAMACLQHLEKFKHYPTGGWGQKWVGLPTRGVTETQPGGWLYNILPYIDQPSLHDDGMQPNTTLQKGSAGRVITPVAGLYCPSRRQVLPYPATTDHAKTPYETDTSTPITQVAKTDYAINGGSVPAVDPAGGPSSLQNAASYTWPDTSKCNGIAYSRSRVVDAQVLDGQTNTYLVGEKWLNRERYLTGDDSGDDGIAYSGDEDDTIRWGKLEWPPARDLPVKVPPDPADPQSQPLYDLYYPNVAPAGATAIPRAARFGGTHSGGCYIAFCDGSVHLIPYTIEPQVHEYLSRRDDRKTVDATQFE